MFQLVTYIRMFQELEEKVTRCARHMRVWPGWLTPSISKDTRYLKILLLINNYHEFKEKKCNILHAECEYHPDLEKFIGLTKDSNLEICEQSFRKINKWKFTTRLKSFFYN